MEACVLLCVRVCVAIHHTKEKLLVVEEIFFLMVLLSYRFAHVFRKKKIRLISTRNRQGTTYFTAKIRDK